MKYIDISEFRELGYLQELNRRFLHPLGLALSVSVEDGIEKIVGIWDGREDAEGIYYDLRNSGEDRLDKFKVKKEFIDSEFKHRKEKRLSSLGYFIESVPDSPETPSDEYVRLLSDFYNYKKRVETEKKVISETTKVSMLEPLLDFDNEISIAIKSTKDDQSREGLILIYKKLQKFLDNQGIKVIQTDKYDADLHEVVASYRNTSNILEVISKGYEYEGKIIRYPKIILG
jgi:molecular chaperone GrpE